tara:strand:- start:532 stop:660 length:129 start_codon:yes stop_codon:yes gene_type:complete
MKMLQHSVDGSKHISGNHLSFLRESSGAWAIAVYLGMADRDS